MFNLDLETRQKSTKKTALLPGSHVFQGTGTIFKNQLDTALRVTWVNFEHAQNLRGEDNLLKPMCDVRIMLSLDCHNVLATSIRFSLRPFHTNGTYHATSRVLTRFYYSHKRINAPPLDIIITTVLTKFHEDWTPYFSPPAGHVFHWTRTTFKLI
ncbi:hypothetical protein DPMN_048091 [Dreissena polymorpha]|uniref:Uncharacterized protein n=1 Tax=Dreissena polymorpha TaxID=45954 RepID=A0A9D4DBM4_DREPO|nr:hypothetical protein DPMN_048091 [Dreissena polymorpha]